MLQPSDLHFYTQEFERTSDTRRPGPSRQLDVYRKKLEYDRLPFQRLDGLNQPIRFDRIRLHLSNTLVRIAAIIRPSDDRQWGSDTSHGQPRTGAPFIFSSRN